MEQLVTLKELVDFIKITKGINQDDLAKGAGYNRSYLSDAISKNTKSVFSKLSIVYSKILKDVKLNYQSETEKEEIINTLNEEDETYITKRRSLKNNKTNDELIYYEVGANASTAFTGEILPVKKNEGVLHISDLFKGSQFAIRISGNSMMPNYPPGAIIGIREIPDKQITPGSVYVIEKENDLWIKRLFYKNNDQDTGVFVCASDSTLQYENGPMKGEYYYPKFTIPIDNVRRLFKVTGTYKSNELSVINH